MLMGQAIVVSEAQLVDPRLADMTITDIINQLRTLQGEWKIPNRAPNFTSFAKTPVYPKSILIRKN